MNAEKSVTVRPMRPEEKWKVIKLGMASFHPVLALLVPMSINPDIIVAEGEDGGIAGAIFPRIIEVKGRKIGFVDFIFTAPSRQGQGIGGALLDAALEWFRRQGCEEALATVDGCNSPSWCLFHSRGFRRWRVSEQWREMGLHWLPLILRTAHFFDAGGFYLRRKLREEPDPVSFDRGVIPWAVSTLILGILLWVAVLRRGIRTPFAPGVIAGCLAIPFLYMAVRTAMRYAMAQKLGLPLEFRPWESGVILASALTLAFGGFMPLTGAFYVAQPDFNYHRSRREAGLMALAEVLASWGLMAVFAAFKALGVSSIMVKLGFFAGIGWAVLDVLGWVFPSHATNAIHLWRWNKLIWAMTALLFVALLVMARGH